VGVVDDRSIAETTGEQLGRSLRLPPFGHASSRYALLCFVLLRGMGLIYFVAFLILALQYRPLFGEHGLLPASQYFAFVQRAIGAAGFYRLPSVFWLSSSDTVLTMAAWLGVTGSFAVLVGFANGPLLALLWVLYLSFVHVGQIFYGYGWESLLCEAGFLSIFLAPPLELRPMPERSPPPELVIVLFRWLTFRVMFGAGLIKIRGDECWRDLTCLYYHYETQPNPSPLSYYFHRLPLVVHRVGVLFNHFVELIAPFGVFGPRRVRIFAGACIVLFQLVLIVSGNLSFLNWLTLVVALSCFDDGVVQRWFPPAWRERARHVETLELGRARKWTVGALAVLVAFLSINPVVNLLSPEQAMNASFDPLLLVNTYGAFGSVSRERFETVIQGTNDPRPGPESEWQDYELPCKPGDVMRRPCLITPYHYRLDWQMWFVQFGGYESQPWLVHLVAKLLAGDRLTLSLFAKNPFPDRPPRFIRVARYRYRFTRAGEPGWWHREYVSNVLPPLSRGDPELVEYLSLHHWL
jgi:hypothetical protein